MKERTIDQTLGKIRMLKILGPVNYSTETAMEEAREELLTAIEKEVDRRLDRGEDIYISFDRPRRES